MNLNIERIENENFDRRKYIRLDKNEGFYKYPKIFYTKVKQLLNPDFLNCYPQPYLLKNELAKYHNVFEDNIYVGSGSDAIIKSAFEIFIKLKDEIIILTPNYAMYYVYADLFNAQKIFVNYKSNFKIEIKEILEKITKKTKVIFISNPNSPVGTLITENELLKIIRKSKKFNTIVFIDEAYYPFSDFTMIDYIKKYENLIISRTFSKAFSLASVRLGYVVANKKIIELYKKVRPIYEINAFAEQIGILALKYFNYNNFIKEFLDVKNYLFSELNKLKLQYIDTKTNFIHIYFPDYQDKLITFMKEKNILIKKSGNDFLEKYIRISLSNKKNIKFMLSNLKKFISKKR